MNRRLAETIAVGTHVTYTWRNSRYEQWTTTEYMVTEIVPAELAARPQLGREFIMVRADGQGSKLGILVPERGQYGSKIKAIPVEIKVTKGTLTSDLTRRSTPYYECNGPDGRKFTNSSIRTLSGLLRAAYGEVAVMVI